MPHLQSLLDRGQVSNGLLGNPLSVASTTFNDISFERFDGLLGLPDAAHGEAAIGMNAFRQSWIDLSVQRGAGFGPQFQGLGASDTVPGAPNGSFPIVVNGAAQIGRVNTPGDDDYYQVQLVAGQSYVFTMVGSGADPLEDPYLELRDSAGVLLSFADDTGPGRGALLRFTATVSGTYYVNARAYEDPDLGPEYAGGYTLTAAIGAAQNPLDTIDYHFTVGTSAIEVYFATAGQTFGQGEALVTAARSWSGPEITAVMNVLATYSAVTPLTFTQTFNQATAEFTVVLTELDPNVLGFFVPELGLGAFSPSTASWLAGLAPGSSAWITLIHEFGHGLGMAHPHDEGGAGWPDAISEIMQGVTSEFNSYGTFLMNQGVFTTMSYNDGWDPPWGPPNASLTTGGQATPMALDIALMQLRYGVNNTYNNGDNTYTLTGANGSWVCIWDAGGTDTIAYNGSANGVVIDLRAATLLNEVGGAGWVSNVPNVHQGFTIAHNVVIENAIGGSGVDTLIGNSANNRLEGGLGNDVINGGAGIDTAVYATAWLPDLVMRNPDGTWSLGGPLGSDTLISVERLDFTDRDVVLDIAQQTFLGDGTSDLLWRNSATGQVVAWTLAGTTLSGSGSLGVVNATMTILSTGDFNGDGRDDILWRRSDGAVLTWEMNGFTTLSSGTITSLGASWSFLGAGDINFDGRDDLVWQRNDGLVVMWQMNGRSISSSAALPVLGPEWSFVGLGDFNGDGSDDFLWRRNDGLSYIWSMNGSGIASAAPTSAQVGLSWEIVAIGDINRDGREDIIWQNSSGVIVGWHMNGASIASSGVIGSVNPAQWDIVGMGDYNGDGRDDLLFQNVSGSMVAWMLDGTSILTSGTIGSVGSAWDLI